MFGCELNIAQYTRVFVIYDIHQDALQHNLADLESYRYVSKFGTWDATLHGPRDATMVASFCRSNQFQPVSPDTVRNTCVKLVRYCTFARAPLVVSLVTQKLSVSLLRITSSM